MKLLKVTAALAALVAVSPVLAESDPVGHFEWQTRPSVGPRAVPLAPVRVWVKDNTAAMPDCKCSMMETSAAECMMDMRSKHTPRSQG